MQILLIPPVFCYVSFKLYQKVYTWYIGKLVDHYTNTV